MEKRSERRPAPRKFQQIHEPHNFEILEGQPSRQSTAFQSGRLGALPWHMAARPIGDTDGHSEES